MRNRRYFVTCERCARLALLVLTATALPVSFGATLWTGPNVTFTKSATSPSDVIVPGKVVLTRGGNQVLFNTAAGETAAGASSPADTLWAFGNLSNFSSLTYQSMESLRNGDLAARILNQPMVVHLINEDIYFSIKFTTWGRFGAGTVSYTRSTAPAAGTPPPNVSITSPSNGAVFTAPADVTIVANATVSSGSVTNVSFFEGSTLLGSVRTAPFQFTVHNLGVGSYSLHAVATAAGISSTSSIVNISVVAPISVSVSITNPPNGAMFTAPANISIAANASATGGTVTNVSFFDGASLLGSVTSPPFNFTANNLGVGSYSLRAVATASGVSSTSAVVNISVVAPISVSVNITNPANGAVFAAPANVVVAADAAATGATVTNVMFFNNNSPVGSVTSPPFSFTMNNLAAGSYSLTAVATGSGISSTSSVVNISVVAPVSVSVSITNPPNGAIFTAPAPVSIAADATASGATVTNVSFFNGTSPLGSVSSPPFSLTVSNLVAGAYSLAAVATASGVSSTSSVVNITMIAPGTISLSAPVIANSVFSFSYKVDPGLTYEVQSSSNLLQWNPVLTNVASSNPLFFSTDIRTNRNTYFRVTRLVGP